MSIKKIISLSVLTIVLTSCQDKSSELSEGNFTLKVTVEGINDNTKILLKKQENNVPTTIDSTVSKNGKFEFSGNIEIPSIYGIFIDSLRGGIFPLLESGTINISAHKDSLYAAKVSGSKLNEELDKFKGESEKIASKINDLFPEFQKARTENNLEKIEELNAKMRAINDENTEFSLNYTRNNPDSYISSMILQSLLSMPNLSKDTIAEIYNNFSDQVKKSDFSKNVVTYLETNNTQKDSIN